MPGSGSSRPASWLVALLAAVCLLSGCGTANPSTPQQATASSTSTGTFGSIEEGDLPSQAQSTLRLIDTGGPFPYSRDGIVFENREGILPREPRGYYHEYTVVTPGSSDRGARRIVAGSDDRDWWSPDHYATFTLIRRTR